MKKIVIVVMLIILFMPINVLAKEKVSFSSCVDGDTAKFILNKKEITVRFLAINTPETVLMKNHMVLKQVNILVKR